MKQAALVAVLALSVLPVIIPVCWDREACASVAYESPYGFVETFGTALRLLRVDLGCKILEKDPEGGYLLFDYVSPESGKQIHHGAIELVRQGFGTHVTVQLSTLPSYHEQMVLDALVKKLAIEHGEPPLRPKDAPPAMDAGIEPDAA
jgi:hypothetical protein